MSKGKKDFSAMLAAEMDDKPSEGAASTATDGESNTKPVAAAPPAAAAPGRSAFMSRLVDAGQMMQAGGLLKTAPAATPAVFTTEAARAAGRLVVKHRVAELRVHPHNPRPVSGSANLDELQDDMEAAGQRDPIHIVPFGSGWAIMEGQRRWLAAKALGWEELECFEHAEMTPAEVYAFGVSVHKTRENTTAIDEVRALAALLATGVTREELIQYLHKEGVKLTDSDVSKMMNINDMHEDTLRQVHGRPDAFSKRHLYALHRIEVVLGPNRAVEIAQEIRHAPEGKAISANSLEAMLNRAAEGDTRRRRNAPLAKKIRSSGGEDIGVCKAYKDGKIIFSPGRSIEEKDADKLHEVVSRAIMDYFAAQSA